MITTKMDGIMLCIHKILVCRTVLDLQLEETKEHHLPAVNCYSADYWEVASIQVKVEPNAVGTYGRIRRASSKGCTF